jgi:hypothetical protein
MVQQVMAELNEAVSEDNEAVIIAKIILKLLK